MVKTSRYSKGSYAYCKSFRQSFAQRTSRDKMPIYQKNNEDFSIEEVVNEFNNKSK